MFTGASCPTSISDPAAQHAWALLMKAIADTSNSICSHLQLWEASKPKSALEVAMVQAVALRKLLKQAPDPNPARSDALRALTRLYATVRQAQSTLDFSNSAVADYYQVEWQVYLGKATG